jgi:hypothetical protein
MRFDDWKMMVRESLTYNRMRDMASQVLPELEKDLGHLYTVPDFDTFEREGEPAQQSNLFTNKSLHTFSFNYTAKGQLYSVDFWKPENKTSKPNKELFPN